MLDILAKEKQVYAGFFFFGQEEDVYAGFKLKIVKRNKYMLDIFVKRNKHMLHM